MPSDFDLIMQDARDTFLVSPFATTYQYRQALLSDWTLTAILTRAPVDASIHGTLYVRLADFATPPAEGDFVIIDGRVYRVVQVTPGTSGDAELSIRLDTREPVVPRELADPQ